MQPGCNVEALEKLSGSSPFADEIALHSDGPDAIPAMRVVNNAGFYTVAGSRCQYA